VTERSEGFAGVEEQVFVGLTWSQSYSAKFHFQD